MNNSAFTKKLSSPWVLIVFLVVALSGLAALWFIHNFERQEYTITRDTSPQARKNPLLAAEKYLQKTGHASESLAGMDLFSRLPATGDGIFVRRLPDGMSKSISMDLLRWVDSGGHLYLVPGSSGSDHPGKNSLLEEIGVGLVEVESSDCGCPPEENEEEEPASGGEESAEATKSTAETSQSEKVELEPAIGPSKKVLHVNIGDHQLRLQTRSSRLLNDLDGSAVFSIDGSYHIDYQEEADKQRSDQDARIAREGAWLLQYRIGEGTVTVLTEADLFFNRHIGDYDHAFFLSWLTRDAEKIWLLYSTNVDPILELLWHKAPLFFLSLLVMLLLLLWRLQMRSGTLQRVETEAMHDIMQHIDATGHYSYRTDKLAAMLAANRKSVLSLWADRKMGLQAERKNKTPDPAALAEGSGITPSEARRAFQQHVQREEDIIMISKSMQRIRTLISGRDGRKQ